MKIMHTTHIRIPAMMPVDMGPEPKVPMTASLLPVKTATSRPNRTAAAGCIVFFLWYSETAFAP